MQNHVWRQWKGRNSMRANSSNADWAAFHTSTSTTTGLYSRKRNILSANEVKRKRNMHSTHLLHRNRSRNYSRQTSTTTASADESQSETANTWTQATFWGQNWNRMCRLNNATRGRMSSITPIGNKSIEDCNRELNIHRGSISHWYSTQWRVQPFCGSA